MEAKRETVMTEKTFEEAITKIRAGETENKEDSIRISETAMAEEEETTEVSRKEETSEISKENLVAEVMTIEEDSAKTAEVVITEMTNLEEMTETTTDTITTEVTETIEEVTEMTEVATEEVTDSNLEMETEETEAETEVTDPEMITKEVLRTRVNKKTGNVLTAVTSIGHEDKSAISARCLVLKILNGLNLASIVIETIRIEVTVVETVVETEVETEEEETIETKETNVLLGTTNKMIIEVEARVGEELLNRIPKVR